jgi:hypothetical protein
LRSLRTYTPALKGLIMARWLSLLVVLALTAQPGKAVQEPKADFACTAESFSKEFSKDKKAAEAKYKGKTIEVTGLVQLVMENGNIMLEGKPGGNNFQDDISILIRSQDLYTAGRLSVGQKVRVTGKLADFAISVAGVVDCRLEELEASKTPVVTPEVLAKELETDAKAAANKYGKGAMVVLCKTWELIERKEKGSSFPRTYLQMQGTEKSRILIIVNKDKFGAIKKGTPLEIRAMPPFGVFALDDNELILQQGFRVPTK